MKERFLYELNRMWPWWITTLVIIYLLRFFTFFNYDFTGTLVTKPYSSLFSGFFFDVIICSFFGGIAVLLSAIFNVKGKSYLRILTPFLFILLIIGNVVCEQCFLIMRIPLDASIFYFSFAEVLKIAGIEHRMNFSTIALFIGLILFLFFAFKWVKKKSNLNEKQLFFFGALVILGTVIFPFSKYTSTNIQKEMFVNNRCSSFIFETFRFITLPKNKDAVQLNDFRGLSPDFFPEKPVQASYPAFHPVIEKSTLSSFFPKSTEKPNIVYVLVESLSSDLVGDRAFKTGHLMPFLDSLSKESLYWPNALSTSQRTQNVLPATLCAIPNTPDGAVFQQMDYPNHWSILSLLKKEYASRFYCGVSLQFSNMRGFMNYHQTEYLVDNWSEKQLKHKEKVNSPWGFPDEDLFKQASEDEATIQQGSKSRFDIFLTISTHDPFVYPNKIKYAKRVEKQAAKMKLPDEKKMIIKLKDKLGSYCYTDDCLRDFFNNYATKPAFKNTIFIITGDHGTEQLYQQPISKYKVPLLIYSPLLLQKKKFQNVVSHYDIPVSLLSLLNENFGIPVPNATPFLGKEVDTRAGFHFNRSQVFTITQLQLKDMYHNGFGYLDKQLYKIDKNLDCRLVQNTKKTDFFKEQLRLYQLFSQYVLVQNKLLPEAEFSRWTPMKQWKVIERKKQKLTKEQKRRRFFKLGDFKNIDKHKGTIKVQVFAKVKIPSLDSLEGFADFVLGMQKQFDLRKEKVLYKTVRPTLVGKFVPNQESKVVYTVEFKIKNLILFKGKKDVYLFMFNPKKTQQVFEKVETVLSVANH